MDGVDGGSPRNAIFVWSPVMNDFTKIITQLVAELNRFIQHREHDRETLSKLMPPMMWEEALQALFCLDCIDEEASRDLDPKLLILVDEPVQLQILSEWLVMSNIVRRWLGDVRPGYKGLTYTDAGTIRIALRSDFNEVWVNPVAAVSRQATPDSENTELILPDVWSRAFFKEG